MAERELPPVETAGRALFDAHQALIRLGIPFILDGGTLLGFYRDGKFCEDDHDDIDLTCHAKYWHRIHEIANAFSDKGFHVYHEWPLSERNHWSAQISFRRDGIKIDLMFKHYDAEKGKVWWTVYGGGKQVTYKAVPIELLATAKTREIYLPGVEGPVVFGFPELTDEYLEYRYGDWRTPLHRDNYSCHVTDLCIVKPNTYEAI